MLVKREGIESEGRHPAVLWGEFLGHLKRKKRERLELLFEKTRRTLVFYKSLEILDLDIPSRSLETRSKRTLENLYLLISSISILTALSIRDSHSDSRGPREEGSVLPPTEEKKSCSQKNESEDFKENSTSLSIKLPAIFRLGSLFQFLSSTFPQNFDFLCHLSEFSRIFYSLGQPSIFRRSSRRHFSILPYAEKVFKSILQSGSASSSRVVLLAFCFLREFRGAHCGD